MNFFYQPEIPNGVLHLDEIESRHCVRVLRKKTGDEITVVDGKGTFYNAVVEDDNQRRCTFKVIDKEREASRDFRIHIALAPTKNQDRTEWFVEKAVEIGVDRISFVECDNSERTSLKLDRITKVAVSAMKQSQRATLPDIQPLMAYEELLSTTTEDQRFIAYVDKFNKVHLKDVCRAKQSVIVLIGPEGDFTPEEVFQAEERNYTKVSLGNARLRTETAGIVACQIINLINTD